MVINNFYGNPVRIDGYEIRSAAVAGNIPHHHGAGASAAVQGIEAGIRAHRGAPSQSCTG